MVFLLRKPKIHFIDVSFLKSQMKVTSDEKIRFMAKRLNNFDRNAKKKSYQNGTVVVTAEEGRVKMLF